jgi:hypothetical protein
MSVFSQLFRKKKPIPKTLEQRVDELVLLDADQQLAAIVNGDDDALRLGAIDRAGFSQAIALAFDGSLGNKVQFQAKKRLAVLIDSAAATVAQLAEQRPLLTEQLSVLELCQQGLWLAQVLEQSDDRDLLLSLATTAAGTQVRQMAAKKIDNPEQLKALVKHSKNSDKAVFKIARDKLDQQREQLQQQQTLQQALNKFLLRLENHSKKDYDKLYRATLGQLLEHWQNYIDSASDSQRAQVATLQGLCDTTIGEYERQQLAIEEQVLAVASAQGQQQQLLAEMAALLNSLFELTTVETQLATAVEAPLVLLGKRWLDIENYAPAPRAERDLFARLTTAVKAQLLLTVNEGSLTNQLEGLRIPQVLPSPEIVSPVADTAGEMSADAAAAVVTAADTVDGAIVEKASAERTSAEESSTEEPSTEEPSTEEPSTEEPSTEASSIDSAIADAALVDTADDEAVIGADITVNVANDNTAKDNTAKDNAPNDSVEARSIDKLYALLRRHLGNATALSAAQLSPSVLSGREYLSHYERASRDKINDEKSKLRQLTALIRRAELAVKDGALGPATGLRRSIEEKRAPLDILPESVQRQLELLDQSLEKLLDWKQFAVAPKKQQLVDAMTLLVDSAENPDALAIKIKRLQDQWKTLSKGGRDQDTSQWQHFQQLATKAYEPCKAFYQVQAQARQQNLADRQTLVQQLHSYISLQGWTKSEPCATAAPLVFKEVEKILTTALAQWQQHSPVDRGAGRDVQAQFDQQLSLIREQLQRGYEGNRLKKQQLVSAAEGLLLLDDHRRATTEVKALQVQWKAVGPAPQRDDRLLWKAFRGHCDGVFERRDQQISSFKTQLEDNKQQATTLSSELKGLAERVDQALLDSRSRAEEINTEFHRLEGLPKASASALTRDFASAQDLFQQAIKQQREGAKERVWNLLLEAADSIRLFQLEQLAGTEPGAQAQQEIQMKVEALVQLPKNGARHLLAKLQYKLTAGETAANQQILRQLCIRAEIVSGQDTPAADQAERMAMQVARLKTDFGQESGADQGQLDALVFDWVDCGPVASEDYQPLLQRFLRCRQASSMR